KLPLLETSKNAIAAPYSAIQFPSQTPSYSPQFPPPRVATATADDEFQRGINAPIYQWYTNNSALPANIPNCLFAQIAHHPAPYSCREILQAAYSHECV